MQAQLDKPAAQMAGVRGAWGNPSRSTSPSAGTPPPAYQGKFYEDLDFCRFDTEEYYGLPQDLPTATFVPILAGNLKLTAMNGYRDFSQHDLGARHFPNVRSLKD